MNYTALTIGPIHKTLQSVKSTKAIWSASYMFSYLMREIITELNALNPNSKFILPYFGEVVIKGQNIDPLNYPNGAGLFPDRIILEGEQKLQSIIDKVVNKFAEDVSKSLRKIDNYKNTAQLNVEVKEYLKNYLNLYYLNVELDNDELIKEKSNIILRIDEYLYSLELQQRRIEKPEPDYLNDFFENVYYNFLIEKEFDKDNKRFPSTIEIAKSEYKAVNEKKFNYLVNILLEKKGKRIDSVDTQKEFIRLIKDDETFGKTVRQYQKYIAVVQADGDNMGGFIKHLYNQPEPEKLIERFSKNLLSFTIEAVKLIEDFKGIPIYAGGDDLLFFAPVAHTTVTEENGKDKIKIDKTIITLIDDIDKIFNKYFTGYNEDGIDFSSIISALEKKPSMSYGVSISYYKFPLNEALEEGVNQLFYVAKQTNEKNAVSYAILKHSGQTFGTTFHKSSKSYTTYKELLTEHVTGDNFIHSIVYKLEPQQEVLFSIGKETNDTKRNQMFDNFFENNFDESVHTIKDANGNKKLIPFLEKTKQLFKDVYCEEKLSGNINKMKKQNDKNLQKIYAALRFIDFLLNKEERDE